MKLARIEYLRPETEAELALILARHGVRAAILAGGQSLLPQLAMRARQAEVLIDINRLTGVPIVRRLPPPARGLVIGPLARHRDIAEDPEVRACAPMLATAALHVGNPEVRNRGTFCGSLAYADPAAEFPVAAVALGARILLKSASGERELAAEDFFTGSFATARRDDEFVAAVRIDAVEPDAFHFFDEIGRRPTAPAFATLALLAPGQAGPRLVVGSVTDRPRLLVRTARVLADNPGDAAAISSSLREEIGDMLAGSDRAYRLHLVATLLERARAALARRRTVEAS